VQPYLDFCRQLAHDAGQIPLERLHQHRTIEQKSSSFDVVTDADTQTQAFIIERIRATYPDHGILAEEGDADITGPDLVWVVDPIDGTTNYSHRFPLFTVSLALCQGGQAQVGVVHLPALGETFWAMRGGGAFHQGQRLAVSAVERLDRAIVATGFPYQRAPGTDNNLTEFARVVPFVQGIRRTGAASLDLAYVAAGLFDGYWEFYIKPWDVMAGMLLVHEAGGQVSPVRTGRDMYGNDGILASNGRIHSDLRRLLNGA
jgi:myo-inositol-1(or 4)-monophosphatase